MFAKTTQILFICVLVVVISQYQTEAKSRFLKKLSKRFESDHNQELKNVSGLFSTTVLEQKK